jgi:hypothetical protein
MSAVEGDEQTSKICCSSLCERSSARRQTFGVGVVVNSLSGPKRMRTGGTASYAKTWNNIQSLA